VPVAVAARPSAVSTLRAQHRPVSDLGTIADLGDVVADDPVIIADPSTKLGPEQLGRRHGPEPPLARKRPLASQARRRESLKSGKFSRAVTLRSSRSVRRSSAEYCMESLWRTPADLSLGRDALRSD
jgi:hypothetical protein